MIGIERLGPCTLTGIHAGETLVLPGGPLRCTPEGGDPYTLRKGDFCWFPAGVEDTWVIEETYVKLFSVTVPGGARRMKPAVFAIAGRTTWRGAHP